MTARTADTVVVGGGLIGCALAAELAGRGQRVVVIDRGEPGAEASSAAAGMLSPQADIAGPSAFFDFAVESRELHARWSPALCEETGVDVGYRRTGLYRCVFAGGEDEMPRFAWQRARGLSVEPRDPEALGRELDGRLAASVERALFFPEEAVVNPRRLARAAWLSAERRGVRFLSGIPARRLLFDGRVCSGVETDAEKVSSGAVVNAAGAWAASVSEGAVSVPVFPVRGQIVEVRVEGRPLTAVIHSEDVYVVGRPDGTALVGSTLEHVGFRKEVTAGAVQSLLSDATRLLPSLSTARFETAWSGLRPGTPDGLPILGPSPVPGLFLATGHFRNGILLAPATARRMADLLVDGRGAEALAPFSASRFAAAPSLA